jgi:two-component system response regulator HydG
MAGLVARVLSRSARVLVAASVREAVYLLEGDRFGAVVCDLRLPDGSGLDVLRRLRSSESPPPFILMTAYASVDTAVQAMREGAIDYITKPFDPEELRALVEAALGRGQVGSSVALAPEDRLGPLLGRSAKMHDLFSMLRRLGPTETQVLLLGETGTGKELVARALHELSPRGQRPFYAVNCAAIPRELLESELFGHKKGSFTGAETDRVGLFEAASGSTLLLDEIGDMRAAPQAKLTRVLEQRSVRRVGEANERPTNVRIVAATHRNLRTMVSQGRFREDLWFRLAVCTIEVPPLRERREDIALLSEHFLAERGPVVGATATRFSDEAMARLAAHDWPGNVRELRSVVERAALFESSDCIGVAALPPDLRAATSAAVPDLDAFLGQATLREAHERARDEVTRRYLTVLLKRFDGDVARVAAQAGVERESAYRLLRRYGLTAGGFRAAPNSERPPASTRRSGGDRSR